MLVYYIVSMNQPGYIFSVQPGYIFSVSMNQPGYI